jgi:hypothetical protein
MVNLSFADVNALDSITNNLPSMINTNVNSYNDFLSSMSALNQYASLENTFNQVIEIRKATIFPVDPQSMQSTSEDDMEEVEELKKVHDVTGKFKSLIDKRKSVFETLNRALASRETLQTAQADLKLKLKDWHYAVTQKAKFDFEPVQDLLAMMETGTFEATQGWDKEIDELQAQLGHIDLRLSVLREAICTGLSDIKAKSQEKTNLCAICFENEVTLVAVPCGHTICNGCAKNLNLLAPVSMVDSWRERNQAKKCPTCRTDIKEMIKFFFSV